LHALDPIRQFIVTSLSGNGFDEMDYRRSIATVEWIAAFDRLSISSAVSLSICFAGSKNSGALRIGAGIVVRTGSILNGYVPLLRSL